MNSKLSVGQEWSNGAAKPGPCFAVNVRTQLHGALLMVDSGRYDPEHERLVDKRQSSGTPNSE